MQRIDNLTTLDLYAIISLVLQIAGYQNDMAQSSNDDLMRELQRQNREYLEQIIENQKLILQKLSDLSDSPIG